LEKKEQQEIPPSTDSILKTGSPSTDSPHLRDTVKRYENDTITITDTIQG
jgi:hypothetical protein